MRRCSQLAAPRSTHMSRRGPIPIGFARGDPLLLAPMVLRSQRSIVVQLVDRHQTGRQVVLCAVDLLLGLLERRSSFSPPRRELRQVGQGAGARGNVDAGRRRRECIPREFFALRVECIPFVLAGGRHLLRSRERVQASLLLPAQLLEPRFERVVERPTHDALRGSRQATPGHRLATLRHALAAGNPSGNGALPVHGPAWGSIRRCRPRDRPSAETAR